MARKAFDINDVREYIEVYDKSGCKLLSKHYNNNAEKLLLECSCGNIFSQSLAGFKTSKAKGCKECKKILKKRVFSSTDIENILDLYRDGQTIGEIAKLYQIRYTKISDLLKDNNIKIKNVTDYYTADELATTRKYGFKRDYFDSIDTEQKAYWLGFLFADGNVHIPKGSTGGSKGGTVEIGLKASDDYHINNFIRCIDGENPIEYRDVKLGDKTYPSARVQLNSIEMSNDLIHKGCIPRKSLVLEPPKHLPQQLIRHFIRGYFDGDGCICFKKGKYFTISMEGTVGLLNWIKDCLKNIGIDSISIYNNDNTKSKTLSIFKHENYLKFFNYIYKDKSVFLERKYQLMLQALTFHKKEPDISEVAKLFCSLSV